MVWRYTLIPSDGPATILDDEPVKWDNVNMTLSRDQDKHGISFLFSSSSLEFIDLAYWMLKEEYLLNGVDGYMGIRIEWKCDDCVSFKTFFEGMLDFASYKEYCGSYCYISMGIEDNSAQMLLKNRQDTSVDLGKNIAYDGTTVLTDYAGLGKIITVPSKAIFMQSQAATQNEEGNDTYSILSDASYVHALIGPDEDQYSYANEGVILPKLNNSSITELADFTPQYQHDYLSLDEAYSDTEIFKVNNDSGLVLTNTYNVSFRFKGSLHFKYSFGSSLGSTPQSGGVIHVQLGLKLQYGDGHTDAFEPVELEYYSDTQLAALTSFEHTINFDYSWSGPLTLSPLDKVYCFFTYNDYQLNQSRFEPLAIMDFSLTEDSFFTIDSATTTAPSDCKTFLIHETGARIIEGITNNRLTFKSEYYGRTDSQPFVFNTDGCGSLRTLTNGLLLRRALLQDSSSPNPAISFKQFFDDCNALDCVGIGIEGDTVRMEPVQYFYQNIVVFTCDGVNTVEKSVRNDRIWTTWKFGFDKYETESTNGLDAVHTKREYRTSIINSDATLEKHSKTIYDAYAIEATRRKYGTTEDWRYDSNIFGLCLYRNGTALQVEQGNLSGAANLFDPPTEINYRVTPIRNALRWFHWVAQCIKRLTADRKMLFNAGEGNYVAKAEIIGGTCKMEAGVIAENEALSMAAFLDLNDALPFIEPEQVTFTYPLGLNEFIYLKENMYGLIKYRRYENEQWSYGWIDKLEPDHEVGQAKFTLVTARQNEVLDTTTYINGILTEDSRRILTETGEIMMPEGGIYG